VLDELPERGQEVGVGSALEGGEIHRVIVAGPRPANTSVGARLTRLLAVVRP
jgi:hypothetical protein